MARRIIKRRKPDPDPRFGDLVASRFINQMMMQGRKATAQSAFYQALDIVAQRTGRNPIEVFHEALESIKPRVEVKSRRVGGATYQVPIEVRAERRESLGMKWLVGYARERKEKGFAARLANEIMDALNQSGGAFRKKEDTHRMAEANKAFAHYRW